MNRALLLRGRLLSVVALLALSAAPLSSAFTARGNGLLSTTPKLLSSPTTTSSIIYNHHEKQPSSRLHMMSPHDIMDVDSINALSSFVLSRGSRGSMENAVPPSEGVTLTILAGGFAAIVWFLISEYKFLKEKKEDMTGALGNKKDFTWFDLIDYRLDYFFSTSEWAKVILLFGLSYVLVVVGAALLVIGDSEDYGTISEAAWTSWTYVVDPGAQADAPSDFIPRTVSLVVTLGGLLVFALLIGIVGESIGHKLDAPRLCQGHVIHPTDDRYNRRTGPGIEGQRAVNVRGVNQVIF